MKDMINNFYRIAKRYSIKYPKGNNPFQMVTRLVEECGEIATEVNRFENSGVKRMKHGEPTKEALASEIKDALIPLFQIAVYYSLEDELNNFIEETLEKVNKEGIV